MKNSQLQQPSLSTVFLCTDNFVQTKEILVFSILYNKCIKPPLPLFKYAYKFKL